MRNVALNKQQAGFAAFEMLMAFTLIAVIMIVLILTIPYGEMSDKSSVTAVTVPVDQRSVQVRSNQVSEPIQAPLVINEEKRLSDTYLVKDVSSNADLVDGFAFLLSIPFIAFLVAFIWHVPLKNRGNSRPKDELPTDDTSRLTEAQSTLDAIKLTSATIINNEIKAQIERVISAANAVLDKLKDDPENLAKSGKFINIYLTGIGRVIDGYAKIQQEQGSQAFELRLNEALNAAEALCLEQRHKLFDPDRFNLDVNLDVLTQQMKYEGV